ncbi:MAG: amino acid adenylation domain-containing protein [Flavobacteriaceae bacterium]|nr:MAG: amino acid adenylation domain-containing protein [Flavobacteriaceae bacterium]
MDVNSSQDKKDELLQKWLQQKQTHSYKGDHVQKRPENIPVPASSNQKRLWLLQQMHPDNPFYHYIGEYHIKGELDSDLLLKSFRLVVDKHEILRTTFDIKNNEIFQVIHPKIEFDIFRTDLSNIVRSEQRTQVKEQALLEARKLFDLVNGPLVRINLFHLNEKEYVLIICMHHLIMDKWSAKLLCDEIALFYRWLSEEKTFHLQHLPFQFGDYAYWQQQKKTDVSQLEYWGKKLSGDIPFLKLPYDYQRPSVPSYKGSYNARKYNDDLCRDIKQFCRFLKTTPYVVLLTAYKLLLYKYSGQNTITIGTPVTHRNQKSLEELIGFFDETLPLKSEIVESDTLSDVIQKVKQTHQEALSNKDVTFETIVDLVKPERILGINPIFQTMFIYHYAEELPALADGLTWSYEPFDLEVAKFDLTLYVAEERGKLSVIFEYAHDLFEESTIERTHEHLVAVIKEIINNSNLQVSELSILSKEEKAELLTFGKNQIHYMPKVLQIHHLFEQCVTDQPNNIAVIAEGKSYSYQEVNNRANSVALKLIQSGVTSNMAIGLFTDRSVEMIVGILAILKAGGAYVPLDPEYPENRCNFIAKDANIKCILSKKHFEHHLTKQEIPVLFIDEVQTSEPLKPQLKSEAINENHLAYILYTSGSSGQPKGVVITHANLIHSTIARFNYYEQPPRTFLLTSSFTFDSSVAGIFWTLCSGGALLLPKYRVEQDMYDLSLLIKNHIVTHTLLLPSLYNLLLEQANPTDLASLHTVIVAGETCSSVICKNHFNKLPQVNLYNEYGPTEATVWSTVHKIASSDTNGSVPIGRPVPNTEIYIVDKDNNLVPRGVMGELVIGGTGIAKGYINKRKQSAKQFIDDSFNDVPGKKLYKTGDLVSYRRDGLIEFHGRVDRQTKIRGYRIELDEIGEVIKEFSGIEDVVISVESSNNKVAMHEDAVNPESLTKILEQMPEDKVAELLGHIENMKDQELDFMMDRLKEVFQI